MAVTTLAIPGGQAANADVTVTLPESIPANSLALIRVEFNPTSGGTNTVTMPAGWTLVRNQVFSASFHSNLYAKAVGVSDSGASVLVDITSTTSKTCAYGLVLVGADIADLDDVAFVDVSASSTSHTNPATSSTPAPARVAVSFCGTRGSAAVTTITPPAGFTAVASAYNTGSGACAGMVAVNLTEDSDGVVGGGTWGLNAAQGAALYTLAIAAAASVSTVNLTPAAVTLTARPTYPTAVVNLTPATVASSARPVTPAPGQVTVTLLPAVLAVTGVQLPGTPAGQVSLQPATVGASSTPVTPTPGQVTLALAVVTLLLQGQPLAPAATGGVVSLQPALVTVQGRALTSTPGSVTVTLQAAAVLFLAVALQPPTGDVEPLRILAVGRPRPAVVGILRDR